ncbi:MAG: DegT/DnrJ/EryC1/StrS family aminotransferase [Deltaproteobacteria bacterium]|nr:DegT/DnrJ/EryC1/StrS family aminotransferase [Deltaproteobacteria bacterium]
MRIPFGTVEITEKSRRMLLDCLDSGRISGGRKVREFEERFADLIGVREAVAVSSGTDADTLAVAVLHDFGATRDDEVIVPALSFVATGSAVVHAGFRPVFVDIDPLTLNIDPGLIENAITEKTRAILPVHLMGKPAAMEPIQALARKHNLLVIEDAAEAFGAVYKGRNVGSLGDLSAFSLYVAHIITTGEGGVILTDNEEYAGILRSLRGHGRACKCRQCVSNVSSGFCEKRFSDPERGDIRFVFERLGYSSKMNELEASLGLGALDNYHRIVNVRHANLMRMITGFEEFDKYLQTFAEEPDERIGPHAFPFVVRDEAPFTRDEMLLFLEKIGVDGRTLFSSIPTQCGGFEFLGYRLGDFPQAENAGLRGIHIGVHQHVSADDIDWFINRVGEFIHRKERG